MQQIVYSFPHFSRSERYFSLFETEDPILLMRKKDFYEAFVNRLQLNINISKNLLSECKNRN